MSSNRCIFLNINATCGRLMCVFVCWALLVLCVALGGEGEGQMSEGKSTIPNIVDELSYSTIRLRCARDDGSISVGTGFAMAFKADNEKGKMIPVLLTNRHVVRHSVKVSFVLTEMVNGKPAAGRFPLELPIPESGWKMHPDPDVDLCALPIGMLLNALKSQGKEVKITYLPMGIIAKKADIDNMFQLDEVVMIGYPDAISDEVNNQPIFRRGILATNPSLDYNGKKEFLIDIAAYSGSSGSPVFVYREGVWYDRRRGGALLMNRPQVFLIGVLHSGFEHRVDGEIVPVQIPTAIVPVPRTQIPNNLGVVLKAERIMELEQLF